MPPRDLTEDDLTVLLIHSKRTHQIGIARVTESNGTGPTDDSLFAFWARQGKTWRAPSLDVLQKALAPVFGEGANSAIRVTCEGLVARGVSHQLSVSVRENANGIGKNLFEACSHASSKMGWGKLTRWKFSTIPAEKDDPVTSVTVDIKPVTNGEYGLKDVIYGAMGSAAPEYTVLDLDDGWKMEYSEPAVPGEDEAEDEDENEDADEDEDE